MPPVAASRVILALLTLVALLHLPQQAGCGIAATTEKVLNLLESVSKDPAPELESGEDVDIERVPIQEAGAEALDFDYSRSLGAASSDHDLGARYRKFKHLLHFNDHERGERGNKLDVGEQLSPVILVPGYGGSRLEGKRNKAHAKHYFCERNSDWSNIWIDLKLMLPYMIDCLIEDFRLEFDPKTNTTRNAQGVEIRVCDPDDLSTVEYLTDIHLSSFGYFAAIIKKLTRTLGYRRNINIKGAPYDFRKAPNELGDFFVRMRRDCERLSAQLQQRVTFICHSMGCNNVLHFLQQQSQQWKDEHVLRVISLAAPWGGSMQAVRATAFGDNLGMPYLFDEAELKVVQQSVPSTMYLFPNERVFQEAPLIITQTGNPASSPVDNPLLVGTVNSDQKTPIGEVIRARDFKRFFEKINHPEGYLMWLNTKDLLRQVEAPGVEVWCLYGKGLPTLGRMEFKAEFPGSEEKDIYDDGDGTVTVQSASFCRQWATEQKNPVYLRSFFANHVDMMKNANVLDTIEHILKGSLTYR